MLAILLYKHSHQKQKLSFKEGALKSILTSFKKERSNLFELYDLCVLSQRVK